VSIASTVITRLDVYNFDLTYVHGEYAFSGGRVVSSLPSTVVAVTTAEGLRGFGEVCPLGPAYLPGFAGGVRAVLSELGPHLIGLDAANLGVLNDVMDSSVLGHGYAKSPVDIACWDLLGQSTGQPLATLLGGLRQQSFPLYMAVPFGSPEEMAQYVLDRRAEGIHTFQMKIGGRPADDEERVAAVVAATDKDDVIIADANGGWRLQQATVAARLLQPFPRTYLEQPCPTIEECLALRRLTSLPMVLDEVIIDVQSLLRAYTANGLDAINLKISRVGGLTKAKLMRDLAVDLGLSVTIEDTWGGDLTTAAVSHLAASTPSEALFAVSFMNDWTAEHVADYQPRSHNGRGSASGSPGLGTEVDTGLLGEPLFSFS